MNRRHFLQKSSFAAIAAAGLPTAIRHHHQTSYPSIYKTELMSGDDQLYYEAGLYHSSLMNFSAAKEEEKWVGLKVKYYKTADRTSPTSSGEFKYVIKSVDQADKANNIWKITTKLDKKDGNYKLPKNFSKNLEFECKPYSYIKIIGKKDAELVSIPYPPPASEPAGSGDEGCFLTTACVTYKGMDDACDELMTLRLLRDEYMKKIKVGRQLVNQYQEIGPAIVKAINSCLNRADIYDYMHRHMIIPSVKLVKEGKYNEATEYYKTFVKALKQQYCQIPCHI